MTKLPAALFIAAVICAVQADAAVEFVRDVRPIFQRHCYSCHGEKKQKSGLRLDVRAPALHGGDKHAPDILPGKVQESPLLQLVRGEHKDVRMPPEGAALTAAEITTLESWVREGALWPEGVDTAVVADKRDHWSFKPIRVAAGPHSVDAFISAKLAEQGLSLSPPADAVSWLRRVSLDLIGLPPTPQQVLAFQQSFQRDPQAARAAAVDRLLESPRYGEHWAQHWLDVVRYADTHGFEVNTERPNAWPYRDYVIDAFNADTPYDTFIREQIVGDAMGQDAATGFLVTASVLLPGQIGKDEPSKRLARQDSLDEMVMNIGQTFLGLSIGCARCHDHKFDPITQRDYYAMQAFVAGVEYNDRELRTPAAEAARRQAAAAKKRVAEIDAQLARFVPLAGNGGERPMVNAAMNTDRFSPVKAKRVRFTILATNNLEPCIDELEVFDTAGTNVALAANGGIASASGSITVADRHDLKHINDGLYGNSRSWMASQVSGGWVAIEFPEEHSIDRIVWGRDRNEKFKDRLAIDYRIEAAASDGVWHTVADSKDRQKFDPKSKKAPTFSTRGLAKEEAAEAKRLMEEKRPLEAKIATGAGARVFAGTFRTPDDIHLLSRGDPEQPKDAVTPAVPASLGALTLQGNTAEQQRRRALAEWIASPTNPLTARVMVNRIWQGHFGTGLVDTPSDFGHGGTKPSHPELLDWLASEFVRGGWSVKQMHRLIVLSQTYGQSGGSSNANTQQTTINPMLVDADARLLWRYPGRRLDAEMLRDSMLFVSGQLDFKMHGRGFDLFDKRGGLSGFTPVAHHSGDGLRRMIYAHKVRRETEAVFGAFDCPDAGQSTAHRRQSTTPIQALNLFNSEFTLDQSEAFAARVKRECGEDMSSQIRRAYALALSREPAAEELHDATTAVRSHGLPVLCRALFNSNEFLFIP